MEIGSPSDDDGVGLLNSREEADIVSRADGVGGTDEGGLVGRAQAEEVADLQLAKPRAYGERAAERIDGWIARGESGSGWIQADDQQSAAACGVDLEAESITIGTQSGRRLPRVDARDHLFAGESRPT